MTIAERRARFRELHAREQLFVMPNPWDVGSARLLEAAGFEALATTSAGFAWSLGKLDQSVTRDELVAHVGALAAATTIPLNVDSERCYPDDPGGVAETVRLLAEAGAAGCSIEDYDPATGRVDDVELAAERVAEAAEAAHALADADGAHRPRREPHPRRRRPRRHDRAPGRLPRRRRRLPVRAGPDRPRPDPRRSCEAVQAPVNVLALPGGPSLAELADAGVRRASTGGLLAGVAYGALVAGRRRAAHRRHVGLRRGQREAGRARGRLRRGESLTLAMPRIRGPDVTVDRHPGPEPREQSYGVIRNTSPIPALAPLLET